MANKKFSEFVLKTSTSDVSHIVGYNGAENVQITPANFVTGGGTGVFLPLAGGTMTGNTLHGDNVRSQYGNSGDLQIYHDSNVSFIRDDGTGGLYLTTNGDAMHFQDNTGEYMAKFVKDASVDLYHNNSKKFETTSTGIYVTGGGVFTETVGIGASGIYSTLRDLNLSGKGLSIKNDVNGSNNNWSYIHNTATGSASNLVFQTGNASALILSNTGNGTFAGNVKIEDTIELTDAGSTRGKIELNASDRDDLDIKALSLGSNMKFFTVDSERMRLDASGNLGLGTSSPIKTLDVRTDTGILIKGASGSVDAKISLIPASGGRQYDLGNVGADFRIFDASAGITRLYFDNDGNTGVGTTTPSQSFVVKDGIVVTGASSEAASTTGDYILAVGKNTGDKSLHTQGDILCDGGIFLGGTGTANKLDDYEEGTWTPTLGGTWTTDPTGITATYTKIGQLVSITMQWTGGAKNSSTDGYFQGLPFAVSNEGTGSVSDSGVADRGNCLFANVNRVWLTSTSFGSGANYLSGTYHTVS